MLKRLFNNAARPSYLPEKPVIVVSTIGDDDHRGDSHAYLGLGRIVAEKLGGEFRHINDNTINAAYPELTARDRALYEYFHDTGVPDILFSRFYHSPDLWYPVYTQKQEELYVTKSPHIVTAMNEVLTARVKGDDSLVSHHITASLLRIEEEKLLNVYPQVKDDPLITVMMADHTNYGLAESLIPRIKDLPGCTLFVCSGRRTDSEYYHSTMSALKSEIGKHGIQNRVRLIGYDFQALAKRQNVFNPYIGLISRSDHMVICGDSRSIVSEALSKQQSIYLYQDGHGGYIREMYAPLLRENIIKTFSLKSAVEPLSTHPVQVTNPTERTADRIINDYKRKCRRDMGIIRGALAYVMEG